VTTFGVLRPQREVPPIGTPAHLPPAVTLSSPTPSLGSLPLSSSRFVHTKKLGGRHERLWGDGIANQAYAPLSGVYRKIKMEKDENILNLITNTKSISE
jgi:hypothetical protein